MWNDSFDPLADRDVAHEEWLLTMQWVEPAYSKKKVNWAGKQILMPVTHNTFNDYLSARAIVNNWRASHSFPLNTFQNGLRNKARTVCDDYVVAQRIKRYPSIRSKLVRFPTMTLSQMQDIGGCRAILPTCDDVIRICTLYDDSNMKHDLHHSDDYISNPKPSGYRGVHLIYRYKSDRKATYNSLLIEMQLRSVRQHAWATAVETVGLFVGQALKSSVGETEWLDFFKLMGTGIAILEGTPPVPGTPTDQYDVAQAIEKYVSALDVLDRLEGYRGALNVIEDQSQKIHHYFLIQIVPSKHMAFVRPFSYSQSEIATREYAEAEEKYKNTQGADVVLVSVDSLDQLRLAYPNYFADTRMFLDTIREVLEFNGIRQPSVRDSTLREFS